MASVTDLLKVDMCINLNKPDAVFKSPLDIVDGVFKVYLLFFYNNSSNHFMF